MGAARGVDLQSIQALFVAGSFTGMTEGQLLEHFVNDTGPKAEAAFRSLVMLHGPMVWKVCHGVLPDLHSAEDAFQATFLLLASKANSIRRRESLGAWLYGVARRVAVRAKANIARRALHESSETGLDRALTPELALREELEAMHEELDRLPEKYRAAVVLCHLECLTHAEAGRRLGCPTGTVSIRVARARELLRERMRRRGLSLSAAAGLDHGAHCSSAALTHRLAELTTKAAMNVRAGATMTAGVVAPAVVQLTEAVLVTMTIRRLFVAATGLLVTVVSALGIGLLANGMAPARREWAAGFVSEATLSEQGQENSAGPRALSAQEEMKAQRRSVRNLRMIALAMYNFTTQTLDGRFPPAALSSEDGPLLSWRVALLPYLGQQALYEEFHRDEPWDSPHNRALVEQMPEVFSPVVSKGEAKGCTYYQVFCGDGAMFEGDIRPSLNDIFDGPSQTAMVTEADTAVPWTKPEDLPYDKDTPLPKLGGQFGQGFHVLFADGSVMLLSRKIEQKTLRALITPRGSEVISRDNLPRIAPVRESD
jgi:RNA polymerase sigma factor (sigma-70 family)